MAATALSVTLVAANPAQTAGPVRLTTSPATDYYLSWSLGGSRVVFISQRSGQADLFIVPASGGAPTRPTDQPGTEGGAAWSPDGARLAYSAFRAGSQTGTCVKAPAGSEELRLTSAIALDSRWLQARRLRR